MSERSAAEISLQRRGAAYSSWANTPDRAARMSAAWAARDARFERQVDPDGVLPDAERMRRAEAARKAFYMQMAAKSARVRRERKGH